MPGYGSKIDLAVKVYRAKTSTKVVGMGGETSGISPGIW